MPYQRVEGKGKARDGGNRFDLYQFDEEFFQRRRSRCEDLQRRGIYVSLMLFEVYGFLEGEACGEPRQTLWDGNVFNRANNVNDVHTDDDGNGKGIEFFYTQDERVLALQKAYVRKVIDTVNHLDNVFYEIANAAPRGDLASTGFCLARPGEQYVVYQPADQPVEVSGLQPGRRYHFEWYDTEQCRVTRHEDLLCTAANHSFTPAKEAMVLFLNGR